MKGVRILGLALLLGGCAFGQQQRQLEPSRFDVAGEPAYVIAQKTLYPARTVRLYCDQELKATLYLTGDEVRRAEVNECEEAWFIVYESIDTPLAMSRPVYLCPRCELRIGIVDEGVYYQVQPERWEGNDG